eukprot:UN02023
METESVCHKIDNLISSLEEKNNKSNDKDNYKMARLITTNIKVDGYKFGRILLNKNVIIAHTFLSYASVNLKPITKGHILIMPKRVVSRVSLLTFDELGDLWYLAQKMSGVLEQKYNAKSITFAIQDGKYAGQTIDHVHIHVIPRYPKDYDQNDDIYIELEKEASSYVEPIGVEDDNKREIPNNGRNDKRSTVIQRYYESSTVNSMWMFVLFKLKDLNIC